MSNAKARRSSVPAMHCVHQKDAPHSKIAGISTISASLRLLAVDWREKIPSLGTTVITVNIMRNKLRKPSQTNFVLGATNCMVNAVIDVGRERPMVVAVWRSSLQSRKS
eukprot:6211769-Pleurochrysis_carterae.AAC.2